MTFNAATRAYRRTLHEKATAKLDNTLSHLLTQLRDCNTTTASSSARTHDPNGSPTKLTIPDKFDRTTAKLFRSIGSYRMTKMEKDSHGKLYQNHQTLEDALLAFSNQYRKGVKEIDRLEKQWEKTVGEIWKVGVDCMGEDAMSALFLTQAPSSTSATAPVKEDFSMLFDLGPKLARKRVTFHMPQAEPPAFLYATSTYIEALTIPEQVSKQDVNLLEHTIDSLGGAQIEDLRQIDEAHKNWWNKKSNQIANFLREGENEDGK
ncbi:hypothetical protein N0V90_008165 [Kalmusia sp. IMI 367209]|nr:hypothetical protein N0V90_008165 [Kalmusia sp. IMI 367209]